MKNLKKILSISLLVTSLFTANVYAKDENISSTLKELNAIPISNTKENNINLPTKNKLEEGFIGNSTEFTNMMNAYRFSLGLKEVNEDRKLVEIAQKRCEEEINQYITQNNINHISKSNANANLGENIYGRFQFGKTKNQQNVNGRALAEWKNSPGHNANLLNKNAKNCGFAYLRKNINGKIYEVSVYVFDTSVK
ncbi:CAP domain-containing protein [Peptoniphilus rhinitidis]|uniref:CAP domain-containing protein n=1 Tax=Peptoniphilus rhinitidis TaxID=1175452 RepID=UPI002900ECCD|nr:CAP domain-containing protein [Peptoniphilus rhinitidis]MDU1042971.1 CAP domain-containing protein [Peptoniphilus rhinitidis]MDU2109735.1 CAP domain-containing protein [Peptoniphilus lacydonensis]MDU3751553.1 CAP domain-containing protein [Peptoniphilus rhinitidis]